MAIDIVTTCKYFGVTGKRSQLENHWSGLQSSAPFLYLTYVTKHPFFLNKIAGKNFAHRFLRKVSDRAKLIDFFGQYNSLVEVLRHRGYKYTPLFLAENTKFSPLIEFPFKRPDASAVLDEIESYQKGKSVAAYSLSRPCVGIGDPTVRLIVIRYLAMTHDGLARRVSLFDEEL
jgi:hypothetical protein